MPTIWFALVALMITAYVVLDGFDLGVGALHLFLGKSDAERQLLIRTIGPVWDANEVWLIAGGGTLFFSFPLLYASSFSGFYLPLTMVLWLLVFRGIGIELRGHVQSDVWRGLFDGCFAIGSTLLPIFYGAALANVVRGVPIGNDGYFFEPLWTDWRVGKDTGILDSYTVPGGILALLALMLHGCNYIALKTSGDLQLRAKICTKALASGRAAHCIRHSCDCRGRTPWVTELLRSPTSLCGSGPCRGESRIDVMDGGERQRSEGIPEFMFVPRCHVERGGDSTISCAIAV